MNPKSHSDRSCQSDRSSRPWVTLATLAGLCCALGLGLSGRPSLSADGSDALGDPTDPAATLVAEDTRLGAASRERITGFRPERRSYALSLVATTKTGVDLRIADQNEEGPVRRIETRDSVRGRLAVTDYGLVAPDGEGRVVGVAFVAARHQNHDDRQEDLPADEALIEVASDGRFSKVAYPDTFRAELRDASIAVLQLFQIVRPEQGAAETWTVEEPSFVGRARVRYTRSLEKGHPHLRREIQRVLQLRAAGSDDIDIAVRSVQGGRDIRFDEAHRIAAIRGDEGLVIGTSDGSVRVERTVAVRVDLLEVTTLDPSAASDVEQRLARASFVGFATDAQAEAAMEARIARSERAAIEGQSVDGLLARIGAAQDFDPEHNPEAFEARMLLPILLARDPAALARVAALLEGQFGPVAKTLLTALGEAGTPQAQALLSTVLGDASRGGEMRLAAILSFSQTTRPTAASASALAGVLDDRESPKVAQSALFMLGGVAGRLETDAARGAALRALEAAAASRADDPRWRHGYLVALGNSGHESIYSTVEPYLASEDAALRQGAVRALRRLDDPRARGKVLAVLGDDPSPLVRIEAIDIAVRRNDEKSFHAIARALRDDASPAVRARALDYMASRIGSDRRARDLVAAAARRDPESTLRDQATKALNDPRLRGQ